MAETLTKTAVIGSPINHSLSPSIHNYWIKKNKIKTDVYQKIKIDALELNKKIHNLINNNFIGLNVTIPLKEHAFNICEELSETSKKLKAVNTLTFKNGKVIGNNTDPKGFTNSINDKIKNTNIIKKNVLVVGAGGSARSVVYALNTMHAKIIIANRTPDKAKMLSNDLEVSLKTHKFNEIQDLVPNLDMIINTSSLGMSGNENLNLNLKEAKKNLYIYDLVYKPSQTNLLKEAEINNLNYQNGLAMLVHQAAESFRIWHGVYPEITNELFEILKR